MPPRSFTYLVLVTAVGLTALLLLSSSSRHIATSAVESINIPDSVQAKIASFDIPRIPFTWHKSVQKPPIQLNSTLGESTWYSDWTWLNPWSSAITLDEDRALLPPLPYRPAVYTYYDTTVKLSKDVKEANEELLLTWERAWWSKGFRPVILTQAEAMSNPLYQELQVKGAPAALEAEISRWLAWGHMGTGLLASWYCMPMSSYDDPLLVYLRHAEFDTLTRFENLDSGLFAGEKSQINDALRNILNDKNLGSYKDIIQAIRPELFRIEISTSIAYYSTNTIEKKYNKVAKMMEADTAKGGNALNELMIAHLQTIWQNTFASGIAVLKPLPAHTTKLVEPGQHLAKLLTQCPVSPLQSSCPPNNPQCSPCVGSKMWVQTVESFRNISTIFTIGTIPHPYTLISLNYLSSDFDARHVRRKTDRDSWIRAATRSYLGDGRSGPARVVGLKDVIASEHSWNRGLWFTVEHFPADFNTPPEKPKSPTVVTHPTEEKIAPFPEHWLEELDWHFGFPIPRAVLSHGESFSPIPGQGLDIKGIPADKKTGYDPPDPSYAEAQIEVQLLEESRTKIKSKDPKLQQMRNVAEAWNLGDSEIWKFARAYRARHTMERRKWAEEEGVYNRPGKTRGGRWGEPS